MATKREKTKPVGEKKGNGSARKRAKLEIGQVVGIPLSDGIYGLGHVTAFHFSGIVVTCVLFARRVSSVHELVNGLDEVLGAPPIAVVHLSAPEARKSNWPVVAMRPPAYPPAILEWKD